MGYKYFFDTTKLRDVEVRRPVPRARFCRECGKKTPSGRDAIGSGWIMRIEVMGSDHFLELL